MAVSIITKEDLQEFKTELLEEIKSLFHIKTTEQKLWLRSSEVKALLKISSGTFNIKLRLSLRVESFHQRLKAGFIFNNDGVFYFHFFNYSEVFF